MFRHENGVFFGWDIGLLPDPKTGCFRTWQWIYLYANMCTNGVQYLWERRVLSNCSSLQSVYTVKSEKPHFRTGAYTNFMQSFALTVFKAHSSAMLSEMHTRLAREEPSDRVSHHD